MSIIGYQKVRFDKGIIIIFWHYYTFVRYHGRKSSNDFTNEKNVAYCFNPVLIFLLLYPKKCCLVNTTTSSVWNIMPLGNGILPVLTTL